jgi:hypothetical protein
MIESAITHGNWYREERKRALISKNHKGEGIEARYLLLYLQPYVEQHAVGGQPGLLTCPRAGLQLPSCLGNSELDSATGVVAAVEARMMSGTRKFFR